MRTPSRWLFSLLIFFGMLNLAEALGRSGIPLPLHGRIRNLETRWEMSRGVDDVHLLWIGKRAVQIDAELASQLRTGEEISKKAWEPRLQTPRGTIRLKPSRDFRRMLIVMPWLAAVGLTLLGSAGRRGEGL